MRDKLQRVPTQVGLSSFKNQITMNTDFSALADIVQSTTFANAANGPVTVGLAMAEERGLPSDLKLRVFDPRDLINRNGPFNAFGYEYVAPVTTGTPPNAVTTPGVHNFTAILNCQKYACLLIAHRVAVDERINGTTYQKVIPLDRHKALLVAGAYVVSAYGLAGWFTRTKRSGEFDPCASFTTEAENYGTYVRPTWGNEAACGIVTDTAENWAAFAKTLQVNENGEIPALDYLLSYVDSEVVNRVMSLIVATKINYFNTNHHTGQGAVSHFIQKVLATLFSDISNEVAEEDMKNTAHRIGHWASTHVCFGILNIRTGRSVSVLPCAVRFGREAGTLATDFLVRSDALPAGMAAHGIVHACLSKYGMSKVLFYMPRVEEVTACAKEVEELKQAVTQAKEDRAIDPRALGHVGSMYLTGRARVPLKTIAPIGVIGPFLYHLHPASSMTKSPLITRKSATGSGYDKAYDGAQGYDEAWDEFCEGFCNRRAALSPELVNKLAGVTASSTIAEDAYLSMTSFAGETEGIRRARYMDLTGINAALGAPGPSGTKRARTE